MLLLLLFVCCCCCCCWAFFFFFFFFNNLLTAPKTVSNMHAQVALVQWCANHVQHIERLSRATCGYLYLEINGCGFNPHYHCSPLYLQHPAGGGGAHGHGVRAGRLLPTSGLHQPSLPRQGPAPREAHLSVSGLSGPAGGRAAALQSLAVGLHEAVLSGR